MVRNGGRHPGSALIGKSTSNVRIERLWRDVYLHAVSLYYELFQHYEHERALDMLSNVQVYALHYTYLPIIQRSLDQFSEAYNKHPLRTEHGQSPEQLFVQGVLGQAAHPNTGAQNFINSHNDAVVTNEDEEAIPELSLLNSRVQVDQVICLLSADQQETLSQQVDPLQSEDGRGVDVYISVLQYLSNCGH